MPSSAFECLNVPCTSLQQPVVVNAIGAHHDEMEMLFVISPIIQACDAISGARPGARREIMPATAHKNLK